MAPFSRIHATATEVSSPPEKAMPTRSPTGRDWRTLDMPSSLFGPRRGPCPGVERRLDSSRDGAEIAGIAVHGDNAEQFAQSRQAHSAWSRPDELRECETLRQVRAPAAEAPCR